MRKHSVRKWLHALLDLLPLVVIPVFMVYSHRHQIDSYSVQRTEYNIIHMQQNVINGLPSGTDDLEMGNVSIYNNDFVCIDDWYVKFETNGIIFNPNDIGIVKCIMTCTSGDSYISVSSDIFAYEEISLIIDDPYVLQRQFTNEDVNAYVIDGVYFGYYLEDYESFTINKVQLFNLTQMFGSGNEPTIEEFNTLFPNDYYAVDSNAVAYVPYTRTYNDTDIGSQIFYSLYNSVDKYFNCNKLFSFNGVYNWINFNLFGGNAPLMVDVVYQIIVYEFFMDLIFLIYSVFMFIIDFASNFLEYSFSWSRRGGR